MSHASKQATISPFHRQGSWEFEGGLREQAVRALELAEQVSVDLRRRWEAARARQLAGDKAAGHLVSRERIVERNLFTTAAVVLSAMAAEAFLNFYGVKRIGQKVYDQDYERLGFVPKVTAIIETCCGVRVERQWLLRRDGATAGQTAGLTLETAWYSLNSTGQLVRDQ